MREKKESAKKNKKTLQVRMDKSVHGEKGLL